jgi:hypothetical protein
MRFPSAPTYSKDRVVSDSYVLRDLNSLTISVESSIIRKVWIGCIKSSYNHSDGIYLTATRICGTETNHRYAYLIITLQSEGVHKDVGYIKMRHAWNMLRIYIYIYIYILVYISSCSLLDHEEFSWNCYVVERTFFRDDECTILSFFNLKWMKKHLSVFIVTKNLRTGP